MTKTLYVSDLDGTLLRRDQTLSQYTIDTINRLTEQGMNFSYATARSIVTSGRVTAGLPEKLPVIVHNGSFILEQGSGKCILSNTFKENEAQSILEKLLEHGIYPIVYALFDDKEKYSYIPERESRGSKIFNDSRKGDIRENKVTSESELCKGEVFHFTCIDEPERLAPLHEYFKDKYQCIYHRDIYSGEQWLEIQPVKATKANAILELKKLLGCDRVVCFGDGKNDISMFEIADECYAVENADDELKRIATAVIGSNEDDGVAKWLEKNYRRDK